MTVLKTANMLTTRSASSVLSNITDCKTFKFSKTLDELKFLYNKHE